jgi:hypothetical protein
MVEKRTAEPSRRGIAKREGRRDRGTPTLLIRWLDSTIKSVHSSQPHARAGAGVTRSATEDGRPGRASAISSLELFAGLDREGARDVAIANLGSSAGREVGALGRSRRASRQPFDPPIGARLTGSLSTNSVDPPRGILLPQFQVPALRCWCRAPSLSSCRWHVVGSCLRAPSRSRRK